MKTWPTKKLGEIAAVQMGQSPPGETYNLDSVGLPFFQGKAEFGEEYPIRVKWCSQPLRIAEAGDILLSVRAPVGPTNFATERCCIGRGLAAIRGEPKVCNQRYIRYYLKRFESDIAARGVGSTFTAINRNDIERLELPVPPPTEQERIVKLLDEADQLRKLRAEVDGRTAALIPALFHEMFGDAESKNCNKHSFGDTKILEIIDGDRGNNYPKKTDFAEEGYCLFLNTSNVRKGVFDFSKCDFITPEKDHTLRKGKLSRDDVILTTRGTLGNSALYDSRIKYGNVRINSGMVILRANSTFLLPEYLLVVLNSEGFAGQVSTMTSGSAQPQLPINKLSQIKFVLPPLPVQKAFAARVSEIRELEAEQAKSRRQLDALFQSLLHNAFNGRSV